MAYARFGNSPTIVINGIEVPAESITYSWEYEAVYELGSSTALDRIQTAPRIDILASGANYGGVPVSIPYTSGKSQLFSSRNLPRCRYCDVMSHEGDRYCDACGAPL